MQPSPTTHRELFSDTTGARDDAGAASAGETPPPTDDEPLPDVQGPMRHLGEASMSPRMHACFRRWQITMSATSRAFIGTADKPRNEQPKLVSLVQRNQSVMWFTVETPPLSPPKLEGRIVTVDDRCRVQYTITGIARRNVTDLAPDVAAGTARLLLHTHIEHSKVDRHKMPMANVVVSRCWHTLIDRNHTDIVCRGCRTPSPICTLCLSAVSSSCISADPISTLDVMAALRLDDDPSLPQHVDPDVHAAVGNPQPPR